MGEEFKGKLGSDLGDIFLAENDLAKEIGFFNSGGGGAGKSIIDEKI